LRRVLRPGGVVFLNICTPSNTSDGLWWSPLIPDAIARYRQRCIEPGELRDAWRELSRSAPTNSFRCDYLAGKAYRLVLCCLEVCR